MTRRKHPATSWQANRQQMRIDDHIDRVEFIRKLLGCSTLEAIDLAKENCPRCRLPRRAVVNANLMECGNRRCSEFFSTSRRYPSAVEGWSA